MTPTIRRLSPRLSLWMEPGRLSIRSAGSGGTSAEVVLPQEAREAVLEGLESAASSAKGTFPISATLRLRVEEPQDPDPFRPGPPRLHLQSRASKRSPWRTALDLDSIAANALADALMSLPRPKAPSFPSAPPAAPPQLALFAFSA